MPTNHHNSCCRVSVARSNHANLGWLTCVFSIVDCSLVSAYFSRIFFDVDIMHCHSLDFNSLLPHLCLSLSRCEFTALWTGSALSQTDPPVRCTARVISKSSMTTVTNISVNDTSCKLEPGACLLQSLHCV